MKKRSLLLIGFITLAFILRFYHLPEKIYFTMDEERDAFIVKRILVNHHFTLIGGSVPGGFFIGPFWYYLSAVPFCFSRLNPIGLGAAAALLGVFSVWLIFKVGQKLFSENIGLISAILFSSSYLMVVYNQHYWPLTAAPACALLTLFSLYQIIKKKKFNYAYLLALALILGLQSDPSNLTLLLLTLFIWWFYRLPLKKKEVRNSFFLLVFSHLPLAFFDLRHNFYNSRALLKLFSFQAGARGELNFQSWFRIVKLLPQTFSRLIYVFGDKNISRQLAICEKYISLRADNIPFLILTAFSFILIYWLVKGLKQGRQINKKADLGLSLVSWQLIITFLSISFFSLFFPGHLHEYFLSVLLPSFLFLFSLSLEKIFFKNQTLKLMAYFLLAFLVLVNVGAILKADNPLGLKAKMEAVSFAVDELRGQPFSLDSLSSCFAYGGYRYLFYLKGDEPEQSFMDQHYTWLYDYPPSEEEPDLSVIFVNHDKDEKKEFWQQYNQYQEKVITRKRFADLEVLIVDNHEE